MDTFTGKEIEGSKVKSFKLLNKEDFQILFEDGGEFRIFGKYMHPCYLQHNAKDEGSAQAGSSPSPCSTAEKQRLNELFNNPEVGTILTEDYITSVTLDLDREDDS